jgi:hypothetical protein
MDRVLILQSAPRDAPSWVERCVGGVSRWAHVSGYDYVFMHDELFDLVPDWYLNKVGDRTAIAADLARLKWAARLLEEDRADVVAWFDADVAMFAPGEFSVAIGRGPVFGYEYWLQRSEGKGKEAKGKEAKGKEAKLRIRKNVHNAYCAFRKDCAVLPFLIEATERIIEKVDARFLAPQLVGPKLLTSLHNIVGFELEHRVGAVSPELDRALAEHDETALARLRAILPSPLMAANLCSTLASGRDMDALVERLAAFKSGWK